MSFQRFARSTHSAGVQSSLRNRSTAAASGNDERTRERSRKSACAAATSCGVVFRMSGHSTTIPAPPGGCDQTLSAPRDFLHPGETVLPGGGAFALVELAEGGVKDFGEGVEFIALLFERPQGEGPLFGELVVPEHAGLYDSNCSRRFW